MTILLLLAIQEAAPMNDDALAKEIVRVWTEIRKAFADYRLDDVKKHIELPPGAPVPNREQAKQFADFLPDLEKGKLLKLVREGDRAGYYVRLDKPGVDVAVVRFRETKNGWKPLPGNDTVSAFSTDEALDEERVRRLLASRGALQLTPVEGEEDLRPLAEVRKELEALAKPVRARFVALAWAPNRVAYIAETKPGNVKLTTVQLWRFERKDGAWALASTEEVELPPTGQAQLLKLAGEHPKLKP